MNVEEFVKDVLRLYGDNKPLSDQAVLRRMNTLLSIIERQREALDRIVGMSGDANRCRCGRPTGIPALVSCAREALDMEI